jgi:hypothetical protein
VNRNLFGTDEDGDRVVVGAHDKALTRPSPRNGVAVAIEADAVELGDADWLDVVGVGERRSCVATSWQGVSGLMLREGQGRSIEADALQVFLFQAEKVTDLVEHGDRHFLAQAGFVLERRGQVV